MSNNKIFLFILSFFLIFLLGANLSVVAQPYDYALFSVPNFDGSFDTFTELWDINDNGIMVGDSLLVEQGVNHALISDGKQSFDLGTIGGGNSGAYGINDANYVVGFDVDHLFNGKGFLWHLGNGMIDIGTLGGDTGARSINNNKQITGASQPQDPDKIYAFLWENGIMTALKPPDSDWLAWGHDLNDSGVVVGMGWSDPLQQLRPIMWQNGVGIDLGSLGDGTHHGEAWGINVFDQVVGSACDNSGTNHPFLWDNGTMFSLSNKPGFAWDINNQGQVVGAVFKREDGFGFVWDQVNGLRHLEDLLPPDVHFRIDDATGISENGMISANGPNPLCGPFCNRAFLLVPVKPEMVLSDPVPGVAGQVNTWTITGAKPGAKVTLVYGFKGGGTFVPGCDKLKAVLQMDDTKIIKTVTADGSGVASLDMFVPGVAKGLGGILVQAVSLDVCQESQLTVVNFQ